MTNADYRGSYTSTAQILHWLIASLIVVQYVLAELAEGADDSGRLVAQLALLANHKSVGMTILALAVVRLGWRLGHPPPLLPSAMPVWQRRISGLTHGLIYLAIFAIPLSGWLMSSASAYSVSWFNLFAFPDLVSPSENLAERFEQIHHLAAEGLFILVLLHAAAALKHHFFDKDTVLKRMTSLASLTVFAAALGLSAATLIPTAAKGATAPELPTTNAASASEVRAATKAASNGVAATEAGSSPGGELPATESAGPAWQIDYDSSEIAFAGDQAGAPFTGRFDAWQADITFDPDEPGEASARVSIELASVNSRDSDRDDIARGSDWFDVDNTPTATFATDRIRALAEPGKYEAEGSLTIGQVTGAVTLALTIEQDGNRVTLNGETVLLRTAAFNLGRGDWLDTDWVGEAINVDVTVVADINE